MSSNPQPIPPQHQQPPGSQARMDPEPEYMPRFPGSGRLDGKVALITGGDSGIGRAVAVLFAREGAKVAIVYLEEDEDAETTRDAVEEEGSEALLIKGDVGEREVCFDAVKQTVDHFGRLDILINNASYQMAEDDLTNLSEEQLVYTFKTNIFSYFFMTQAALEHLPEGGAIVNTSSINAFKGNPHLVDYTATKGAELAFSRSMATQLVDKKIRVNTVAPGPIWTPLIPTSFPEEHVKEFGKNAPMGRPGQPNEVAPAYLFLACEDASYITGQTIHPNGGYVLGA